MRTSEVTRNARITDQVAEVDSGLVGFYTGPVPATPESPTTVDNVLVVSIAIGTPASAGPASGGSMQLSLVDGVVANSGTPTFARFYDSVLVSVSDMSIGDEIVLSKPAWTAGEPFSAPVVYWTMPMECA